MKLFTQVALVSAIAVSGSAFAMQPMTDSALGQTTGQDGISVKIKPPTKNFDTLYGTTAFAATGGNAGTVSIDQIIIHDKDGLAPTGTKGTAGAIVLDNFALGGNGLIALDIDADGGPSSPAAPVLNIKVGLPSTLVIHTGDISVAKSNREGVAVDELATRGVTSKVKVLDSMDINVGGASMNIQLGNEPQGAMIKASGTITDGLTISKLRLIDAAGTPATAATFNAGPPVTLATPWVMGDTGGQLYVGKLNVRDTGGSNLTLNANIDISANGLIVTMGGSLKSDIMMTDVRLGNVAAAGTGLPNQGNFVNPDTTKAIGDIELVGVDLVGTKIAVSGH